MAVFLVTGGAGFIGSHLVGALRQRNDVVRVLDNFSTGKRANLDQLSSVDIIEGDVRDVSAVRRAMIDVDYVIHLAALVSVPQSMRDPVGTHEANATGLLNILTSATPNIKRIVLASSCAIYGDNDELPLSETSLTKPLSPYAASKLIGEIYCQTFYRSVGLPTVCLRYFNVYGPRQDPNGDYAAAIPKFVHRMRLGQSPVIYGDGTQTRDFVHVSDIVRANLTACDCDAALGQVFNIATGHGVSLLQLVAEINALQGTALTPEFQAPRAGDIQQSCGDGHKAARLLKFIPVTSLHDGLKTVLS
jgi:UDP-glucose 4-epimerase